MAYYNNKRLIAKVVYTGSIGGNLDGLIDGSISGEIESNVTKIRDYAFYNCDNITGISFPLATDIGNSAFNDCENLENIYLPKAEIIRPYALSNLTKIGFSIILPSVKNIYNLAFLSCNSPSQTVFDFTGCTSVPNLTHTNAFDMISNYVIMIPSSLKDEWLDDTNWAALADHIEVY